jgi:hypothetical protein
VRQAAPESAHFSVQIAAILRRRHHALNENQAALERGAPRFGAFSFF